MSSPDFIAIMPADHRPPPNFIQVCQGGLAALFHQPPGGRGLADLFRRRGKRGDTLRRARAEALLARQTALEALHGCGDVLPALPGMMLSPAEAPALIAANRLAFDAGIAAISGRAQRQITLSWDAVGAASWFRDAPELARGGLPALASALAARAEAALVPVSDQALHLPCDGEDMLLNLVLLGPREDTPAFDAALEAIDAIWTEGFRLKVVGPSPAISFAAIRLHALRAPEVKAAQRALGLPPQAEAPAIQAAFAAQLRTGDPALDPGALKDARDLLLRLQAARHGLAQAGLAQTGALRLASIHRDGDVALAPGRAAAGQAA